ncbi:F0F1 ATP synthase subunit B [Streptomyces sp. SL13]|jgi:F-type H+-transporting ATPase subunit b|uniref:ATP synthase subunit b n=1 Tax=Streptantibioticus silvisoli TaxID=2705255 RepID=A0AA90GUH5_9ACTN|nr:F0F1 ATP synthase subunit B [Streptantibioticus silvisoli]MDI5962682.1 F0F1 ATP synthase subunit B [Streptantibioticus silvisoli]MDI5968283.1 F0F1 ATP synthase subunit B [Streptantibioticus silvisoli]
MMTFLAEGGAQNPLLPDTAELVVGLLCFFIVFGILGKKLLPNIQKTLDERRDAIEGGLERAEKAQAEATATLEEYKAQLAEARHEAARITEHAREQGAVIIAEMREEAQRQRDAIIAAGHAQIEADRRQVTVSLRQEVGRIATDLAGRIVGESLEDSARQSRVIDHFLDDLEEKAEAAR